jgi:hypothetical protein
MIKFVSLSILFKVMLKSKKLQIIVNNLVTIHRNENASFHIDDHGNIVVQAGLSVDNLDIAAQYSYKVRWFVRFRDEIGIAVSHASFRIRLRVISSFQLNSSNRSILFNVVVRIEYRFFELIIFFHS